MGRTATGAVEVYHALCLCQRGKPLGAPLASVVGGLVTDLDSHGLFADVISLQGQAATSGPWWTV